MFSISVPKSRVYWDHGVRQRWGAILRSIPVGQFKVKLRRTRGFGNLSYELIPTLNLGLKLIVRGEKYLQPGRTIMQASRRSTLANHGASDR